MGSFQLDQSFYVTTLVGELLLVKYVYRSSKVFMADKKKLVNLIMFYMLEIDVILGIDWLAAYCATKDGEI